MTEYMQAEIVAIEGDDIVKDHLKRYKKLMTNMFNRFRKDLEQRYESVETIGKGGMKTKYILGKKRDVEAKRIDKRVNNGKGQVPLKYEQAFPIMLLEYLSSRKEGRPLTVNKWLFEIKYISREMFDACQLRYDSRSWKGEVNKLEKLGNVINKGDEWNEHLIEDYVTREMRRLNTYFMQVVETLKQADIITHIPYEMGKCKIPTITSCYVEHTQEAVESVDYNYGYIELSPAVIKKIAAMEQDLQNDVRFMRLTSNDIHQLKSRKIVQEYWKEYKERLNKITDESEERLYLVLTYTAHDLFIKGGDNPIIKWLEENYPEEIELYSNDNVKYLTDNAKEFHEARKKYIVGLAQARQDKYLESGEYDPDDYRNQFNRTKELRHLEGYAEAYEKLHVYYECISK